MEKLFKTAAVLLVAAITINANAQGTLKDRLKKAVNTATESVEKSILNKEAKEKETGQAEQKQEEVKEAEKPEEQPAAKQEEPQLQSYSKYDFIPGEKVIFYEDFSQDAIGDFPALWNTNGSAEVVTTNLYPGKWMKFSSTHSSVWTDQLINLPENYTIEFDAIMIKNADGDPEGYGFRLMQSINEKTFDGGAVPGESGLFFDVAYYGRPSYRTYVNIDGGEELGLSGSANTDNYNQKLDKKYHIAIWIQKARVRVYQEENKLFDLPKAFNFPGIKMDRIRIEQGTVLISNIRIAVGAPDTRNKLISEGRLVTYGIYFDVNKDAVKPESYATLKEIAAALTENPGVRIKIIGHTDSDGADDANLDLSKRRAESVKNELSKSFSIDASRMETEGAGEGKPIAPNDSPVNKALNRRVEFVKL
jgi:outer membrane protein OmpA-like peptidoglycan-associated protein